MRRCLSNLRSASNANAFIALALSLLALTACPGSLGFTYVPDGGGSGGTGGTDSGVATSCATSSSVLQVCYTCHNSGSASSFANLDLMTAGVETRLVNVPAATSGGMAACGGKGFLLNKGVVPATGILIDKLKGTQTCGISMPWDQPMLGAADIACLQAWANGLVTTVGP